MSRLTSLWSPALTGVDTALEAMKWGAYDYITKPYRIDELYELIKRVLTKRALEKEKPVLRLEMNRKKPVSLVGSSRALQEVAKKISGAAKSDLSVLLLGEMGTRHGRGCQGNHQESSRAQGPFIHPFLRVAVQKPNGEGIVWGGGR